MRNRLRDFLVGDKTSRQEKFKKELKQITRDYITELLKGELASESAAKKEECKVFKNINLLLHRWELSQQIDDGQVWRQKLLSLVNEEIQQLMLLFDRQIIITTFVNIGEEKCHNNLDYEVAMHELSTQFCYAILKNELPVSELVDKILVLSYVNYSQRLYELARHQQNKRNIIPLLEIDKIPANPAIRISYVMQYAFWLYLRYARTYYLEHTSNRIDEILYAFINRASCSSRINAFKNVYNNHRKLLLKNSIVQEKAIVVSKLRTNLTPSIQIPSLPPADQIYVNEAKIATTEIIIACLRGLISIMETIPFFVQDNLANWEDAVVNTDHINQINAFITSSRRKVFACYHPDKLSEHQALLIADERHNMEKWINLWLDYRNKTKVILNTNQDSDEPNTITHVLSLIHLYIDNQHKLSSLIEHTQQGIQAYQEVIDNLVRANVCIFKEQEVVKSRLIARQNEMRILIMEVPCLSEESKKKIISLMEEQHLEGQAIIKLIAKYKKIEEAKPLSLTIIRK